MRRIFWYITDVKPWREVSFGTEVFLREYLEAHRKEVVDIMTQLYDREREMKLYVQEREQAAAKDAERKSTLENIKSLMRTMKLSAKEAMNALQIAPKDQKTYLPMLKKG